MRRALIVLALSACAKAPPVSASDPAEPARAPGERPPPEPLARLAFGRLDAPAALSDAAVVRFAPGWTFDQLSGPVEPAVQITEGQTIGGEVFGSVRDAAGALFPDPDGAVPWLPDALDHASLQRAPGGYRLWTHVESAPAALYVTDLARTEDRFEPTATRAVDLTAIGGGKDFCAGTITPWGSLLSSEEYDADLRRLDATGRVAEPTSPYDHAWNRLPDALPAGTPFRPYAYGWIPEFTPSFTGEVTATKHLAMGRFSHEIALVLPDRRTVLLSDDQSTHGGLFLFVADTPEDLSAGTLYAARVAQSARADGGAGALTWVSLGHADPEALAGALDRTLADVMVVVDPLPGGGCPAAPGGPVFRQVTTAFGTECVAPVPGKETLASRLEARRYAAWAGATVEFTKGEGLAWDPLRNRALFAVSRVTRGMTDGEGDLDVDPNPCGAIYALDGLAGALKDTTGRAISSSYVPTRLHGVLTGRPEGDGCHVDGIAEPDNITVLATHDRLIIAEDTLKHANPTLWALDMDTGALDRLATAPWCGEWSGLHSTVDLGSVWLTVSLQHAYAYRDCGPPPGGARPPDAPSTWVGMLGPFPRGHVAPGRHLKHAIDRAIEGGMDQGGGR